MVGESRFTDGIVIDHVAEFAYLPASHLQELYRLDPIGYIDAIARFVQLVATSPALLFAKHITKPETAQLRESLRIAGKVDDRSQAFSEEDRAERRRKALPLLRQHWKQIEKILRKSSRMQEAIRGHVQREFRNCYLADPKKRQSMDHYVAVDEARRLPEPLRSSLLTALEPLRIQTNMDGSEVEKWLDRTVTTQYRVFFEHCLYTMFDYCPAITRSDLAFVLPRAEAQGRLDTITRCIAARILPDVKRREELIPRTLDWCTTRTGERVLNGFSQLRTDYERSTEREKQECIGEINGILKSEVGFILGFALGTLGILTAIASGKEPDPKARALTSPKRLWWLWELRSKDAKTFIEQHIKNLVLL